MRPCDLRKPSHFQAIFFLAITLPLLSSAALATDEREILERMNKAYAGVQDYRARLESRVFKKDGSSQLKEAVYTFKRPDRIRLDFLSPNKGMVLVYPDKKGKVVVRPSGWKRFFKFRISPESFLLKVSPGQRIDQTDLGLLIKNISRSLTDQRRGEAGFSDKDGLLSVRVLAENHFRPGVFTLYEFLVDKELWLPVGVKEFTPEGILQRSVAFKDLRVNIGVQETLFQP